MFYNSQLHFKLFNYFSVLEMNYILLVFCSCLATFVSISLTCCFLMFVNFFQLHSFIFLFILLHSCCHYIYFHMSLGHWIFQKPHWTRLILDLSPLVLFVLSDKAEKCHIGLYFTDFQEKMNQ